MPRGRCLTISPRRERICGWDRPLKSWALQSKAVSLPHSANTTDNTRFLKALALKCPKNASNGDFLPMWSATVDPSSWTGLTPKTPLIRESREQRTAPSSPRRKPHGGACCAPAHRRTRRRFFLEVVQSDGSVAFLKDRIEVTGEFLNMAGRLPESRFRFSSTCIKSACKQWTNGGCGIPERLADLIPRSAATDGPLPRCSIRDQCRWFDQRGAAACRICPLVATRGGSQ